MNLYVVISEPIEWPDPILPDGSGPSTVEPIAELVLARNRGQARYLVCQKHWPGQYDPRGWPRFAVHQKRFDADKHLGLGGEARVLSHEEHRDLPGHYWYLKRPAPQIGFTAI